MLRQLFIQISMKVKKHLPIKHLLNFWKKLIYARVSLSVQRGVSLSVHSPGPRYRYKYTSKDLYISTQKWPGPGPRYPYTVLITRYVRINFVPIVNIIYFHFQSEKDYTYFIKLCQNSEL